MTAHAESSTEQQFEEVIAGLIRNAVFAARDAGETVYKASEDAAHEILERFPNIGDMALRVRLEALLAKWRADRSTYPEEQFGAQWCYTAVKLCEDELRDVLGQP